MELKFQIYTLHVSHLGKICLAQIHVNTCMLICSGCTIGWSALDWCTTRHLGLVTMQLFSLNLAIAPIVALSIPRSTIQTFHWRWTSWICWKEGVNRDIIEAISITSEDCLLVSNSYIHCEMEQNKQRFSVDNNCSVKLAEGWLDALVTLRAKFHADSNWEFLEVSYVVNHSML